MATAAIYARYSSSLQNESSIDAQIRACREFCASRGYTVVVEHVDKEESGSSTRRPGYKALMADVRASRCDVVVTHKLDRLSRNVTDILLTMRELKQHNVKYVSVAEQFDFTTPIGMVILAVLAALAEWYLANLKTEINKGKRERALKGRSNASRPPFGYSREPGQVEKPNDHRDHVLWAFTQYAAGFTSYRGIAAEFNQRSLITTRGGPWNDENVREMIQNPFYAGWVTERGMTDQQTASGTRRRVPRSKKQLYRGLHEPIIPQALFDKCAQIRAKRHREETGRRPASNERYLFGGIAFCAKCGRKLRAGARPDGKYANYLCRSAALNAGCDSRRRYVPEGILAVQADELIARLQLPDQVERRAVELHNQQTERIDFDRRRKSREGELARLNSMFQKGNIPEAYYDVEVARVKAELAALEEPVDQPAAIEHLHQLVELWAEASIMERHIILRTMVERADVDLDQQRVVHWEAQREFAALFVGID